MPIIPEQQGQPAPQVPTGPESSSPPSPGPLLQQPGVASSAPGAEGEVDDAQVDQFLEKAWILIYGGDTPEGEMNAAVLGMLRGGPDGQQAADPVQALADTAATIAGRVISAAVDQKAAMDPAAAFAGLMEVVGELASDATEEGLYDYSQEEIDAAATRSGEALYNQTKETGFFDEGEMNQDVDQMAADSQSGELDQEIAAMGGPGAPDTAQPMEQPPGATPPVGGM